MRTAIALSLILAASCAAAQQIDTQTTVTTTTHVLAIPQHGGGSGCLFVGRVMGLDPYGDNYLSVRYRPYGPRGPANEKDELYEHDQVCVSNVSGSWLFVHYERSGRSNSGWVSSHFVMAE